MAGPIEAKRLFDRQRGWYPRLSVRSDGIYATEYYLVDTSEPHQTLFAMGLPSMGSAHFQYQDSFVTAIDPEPIGGTDTDIGRGFHVLRLTYEPKKPGNLDAIAQPGDKFSDIRPTTQSKQIRFDVNGAKIPQTSREADSVELVVTVYHTNLAWLQAWVAIKNRINSNQVLIPDVLLTPGTAFIAGPRQLLARSPKVTSIKPGLMRVEMPFAYVPTDGHKFQWQNEDADGNPVGPINSNDIQGEAAYPLPGVLW